MHNMRYISTSLFIMWPTTENYEITHERNFWTHKITTRKNYGPTKYPKENTLNLQNSHEGTMACRH